MAELVCSPDDPAWHEHRRAGVTATDIVTIMGLSSHDSEYSLYWRKKGVLEDEPDSDRFRLGRVLEAYIVERWCDERDVPPAHRAGARSSLYRSDDRPWQLATPDRVFYDEPLECKSWADADRRAWDDGPPDAVRTQVLWQMDTLGVAAGHVAVLFLPSGELKTFVIECQALSCEPCPCCIDRHSMRAAGHEFWRRVLGELPPPTVDGSLATHAALKARFLPVLPERAEVSPQLWAMYGDMADMAAADKKSKARFEAAIREEIGQANEITIDGEIVGRRTRYWVNAHQRKGGWVDKLTRVKGKETDSE
jgi:putative phage-type endonuclease